jgi:polyhydroxyalkanoate synthase
MGDSAAETGQGEREPGHASDDFGVLGGVISVDPAAAARQTARLAGELIKIAMGRADVAFGEGDSRFADRTWRDNPFYRVLGQSYRAFEEWAGQMADAVNGPWERQARARYWASMLTAAMSPTNLFWTNPAAVKRAFETGGLSVLRGGRNMLRDLARGGMPQMVNREPFPVGEKLACTPGAVVYRDELFELLQYAATTPAVRTVPLLMVPPEINRHYVLDLAPGRSLAEFAVGSGIQTFMIVWRNPRPELGHGRWGLDDYLSAQARAAEVVKKITRSDTVNWLGLCAGGITAALLLGHQAATGDTSGGSATFIVTMLTNRCPNIVGMSDTPASRAALRRAAG